MKLIKKFILFILLFLISVSPVLAAGSDINNSGKVDIFDYNILLSNFGRTSSDIPSDIDNNGKVDIFDYNKLLSDFGMIIQGSRYLVFNSNKTGNHEIYRLNLDTNDKTQLTNDPTKDHFWGRLSPDKTKILYYQTPKGQSENYSETSLWMMNADGTDKKLLRPKGTNSWEVQGHAEWSPDGTKLVMFGGSEMNPQIVITDINGNPLTLVTTRGGQNIDPSFSPDGTKIVFIACPESHCVNTSFEVYQIQTDGSGLTRLTSDTNTDNDPYFSPNGEKIAWIKQTEPSTNFNLGKWNIWVMDKTGTNLWSLTNDNQINSRPEWSKDGLSIYFHRLELGAFDFFRIFKISLDGSNLQQIIGEPGVVYEFPSL